MNLNKYILVIISIVFVYARGAVTRLLSVSEELGDLQEMIDNFAEHITSVYEMEMFYGDETLKFLLEHTKSLMSILEEEYGDIILITDPLEIEVDEEENFEEENQNPQKQDVLYAGTRKRDS